MRNYLFYLLFLLALLHPLGYASAQECDCPNPGNKFERELGEVNLSPNFSVGNGPTGCRQYQEIKGFVAGRKYLFSFCPEILQGAKYPPGLRLYLLLKDANHQTVTPLNNTTCGPRGGYTIEMVAPSTGSLRAYVFNMINCSTLDINSDDANNTQFGYKEVCNKGILEKESDICPFTLVYKNASGAQNYQLQYWNGVAWVNYDRGVNRAAWQNTSPNYIFSGIVIKETTRFRVLHLGGSCTSQEYSDEITLSIRPSCPTHLQNDIQLTSNKTKYCTGGVLDLKLADDCLPPGVQFNWEGPINWISQTPPNPDNSSVSFYVPDNISPPSPCTAYTYHAKLSFTNIPGCTLTSRPLTVKVCKMLPFRLVESEGYQYEICQTHKTKLKVEPISPWTLEHFRNTLNNPSLGFTLVWDCGGCVPPIPGVNTLETNELNWSSRHCGSRDGKNVFAEIKIDGCISDNPVRRQITIKCQGDAGFRLSQKRVCKDAQVIVNAFEIPAPPGVTYSWDCGGCSSTNLEEGGPHALSWSTPGVKTIRLTAISEAPCVVETTTTQTVTVDLPPDPQNVRLNCGAENTPICVNTPLPIAVEPQGSDYTYTWNCDGCRAPAPSGASANLSWSSPGTKTVTVTVRSPGCASESDVVTLTCNPVVASAPSATIVSTPNSVHNRRFCNSQRFTFSAPEGEGLTYLWEWSGGNTSTERELLLENLTPGAYTLNLTVTNPALPVACGVRRLSTPIRFTVSAPPTLNISRLPEKLCQGKAEQLLLDVENPQNAALSYAWACEGCVFTPSGNVQQPRVSWNTAGTKTLSVTVTNADCPGEPRTTPTVTIDVMQIPPFNLSLNLAANTPLCQGSVLTATAHYDSSAHTRFQWLLDGLPSVTSRVIRLEDLAPKMNYRLQVRVTDSNLPEACRTLRDTADFRVSPRPNCNFKLSRAQISLPDTIRLFDFNANQTAGATYNWALGEGNEPKPTMGDNPDAPANPRRVINYNTPGVKTVSFTVTTPGCPAATCTQTVEVIKCDNRDFSFTLKTAPYCPGGSPENLLLQNALERFRVKWSVVLPNAQKEELPGGKTPEEYIFTNPGRYTFEAAVEDPEFPVCSTFVTNARQEAVVSPAPALRGLTVSQRRCQNVPILFSPEPDGLPPTSTYTWEINGSYNIEQGGLNRSVPLGVSWNTPGSYEVKLTETTQHCGKKEVSATVAVLRNPVAQDLELKTLRRCPTLSGEEITLRGEPAQESHVVDIYDAPQGGNLRRRLRKHSPEWSFPLTASQTYYYEILDTVSGCGSPARVSKEIKAQRLRVFNARAAQGYCENDSANFIAFPYFDSEDNPIPVRWSVTGPSGEIPLSAPETYGPITINWTQAGTYTVALTAQANGCPVFSQNIAVRVVKRPSFLIQEAPENQSCIGSRLRFSATANDTSGSLRYLWRCSECKFTGSGADTLGPLSELAPVEVAWQTGGPKTLTLIARNSPCGELRREYFVNIKLPPVPVACNYPRLICEPSPITLTFVGLPLTHSIELFTSYQGGEPLPSPYTYPNGNRVELRNRNEAHFWVQTGDTIFYGVRDLFSNCPSFYRLPIVLNYDINNRIPTPSVLNSPIPVCRQSATPLTFQVSPGENSPQQWVYFIDGQNNTLHRLSAVERRLAFQTPAPISATDTFFVQVRDTVTGCNSLRVPAIVRVYDPAPPRLNCPVARCGPGPVTFTVAPAEEGPVNVYAAPEDDRAIATLNAPSYEFTTPSLSTPTDFYFEQAVGVLLGCRSLTRARCQAVINDVPRPPVPDAVSKKICPPMAATFRFAFSELRDAELRVYDNNGHLIETIAPHPDSARVTFRTPLLSRAARYFVAYQEPKTGCESERIPLGIELEEHPRVTEITYRAPDCGAGNILFTVSHSRSVDSLFISVAPPLPNSPNPSHIAASAGGVTTFTYQLPAGPASIAISPFNRHCGFGPTLTKELEIYPAIRFDTLYSERNPPSYRELCITAKGAGGRSGNYEYQILSSSPPDPNYPDANTRNTTGRFCDSRIKINVVYLIRICDPYYTALGRSTCCVTKQIRIFSDFMRAQNAETASSEAWRLYPNPTQGAFTLRREGEPLNRDEIYTLDIVSALGRSLVKFPFSAAEGESNFELPQSLTEGLYFAQVRDQNGRILLQERLLLQR